VILASEQNGKTPLHLSATQCFRKERYQATIKLLLDCGLDISALDMEGKTPLHYTVKQGDLTACVFLRENGADIQLLDKQWLLFNGKYLLATCLRVHRNQPNFCFFLFSGRGRIHRRNETSHRYWSGCESDE